MSATPGLRAADARDLLGDLLGGQVTALAGFRALADLDLQFVACTR
jgi:hypothetical protein